MATSDVESDASSYSDEMPSDILVTSMKKDYTSPFEVLYWGTIFSGTDSETKAVTLSDASVVRVDDGSTWRCVSRKSDEPRDDDADPGTRDDDADPDTPPVVVHQQLSCAQEEKLIIAAYKESDPKARADWAKLISAAENGWDENVTETDRRVVGNYGPSTPLVAYIKKRHATRKRKAKTETIDSILKKKKAVSTEISRKDDARNDRPSTDATERSEVANVTTETAQGNKARAQTSSNEAPVQPARLTTPEPLDRGGQTCLPARGGIQMTLTDLTPEQASRVALSLL